MGVEHCISSQANFAVLHKLRMFVSFPAKYMISLNVIGLYIASVTFSFQCVRLIVIHSIKHSSEFPHL